MKSQNKADVEEMAQAIHEATRRTIGRNMPVIRLPGQSWFEWDQLPEEGREARREMARYILDHFWIVGRNTEADKPAPITAEDLRRLNQWAVRTRLVV